MKLKATIKLQVGSTSIAYELEAEGYDISPKELIEEVSQATKEKYEEVTK